MADSEEHVSGSANPAPPTERTIIDALADLLQTVVDWLRQEAEEVIRTKLILPLQRLGLTLASAYAAVALAVFGLVLIAIASLLLLAEALTWPGALYLIGGIMVLGSVIFAYIKGRLVQK